MLCRVCHCDKDTFSRVRYHGEDRLIVCYKDIIVLRKSFYPLPFRFFSEYSEKNGVVVLFSAKVVLDRCLSGIFVFEKGVIACVAESVEEGALKRKIYKEIGLCVGEDYKSPFTCELIRCKTKLILCATFEKVSKEDYGILLAYKNLFPTPVLFCFSDICLLVRKKIVEIKEDEILSTDFDLPERNKGNGRGRIVPLDR